jgi:hypothetical protein
MTRGAQAPDPMRTQANPRAARSLAIAAAGVLALAQAGLWLGIEPIATWSYDLSWWSAIALTDAVVHLRRGASILLSRPRGFLGLAVASGAYWLLYECANLRLRNWYYVGIPPDLLTRTVGVYLSFATVLPGVLEIHSLISSLGRPRERARAGPATGARARAVLLAAGVLCAVLPWIAPRAAYPLIWGAAFLLLEPWLAARDEDSLLARWSAGDRAPVARMIAAGLVAGAMWECWNWRSPAKWIYTVPLFEEGKLFEMPYLGFVGFLPFALGCHSVARALVAARILPEWDPEARSPHAAEPSRTRLAALLALAFSAVAIAAVDRSTIRGTKPGLADLPRMTPEAARRLEAAGIRGPADLLAARARGVPGLDEWADASRLMETRGLGRRGLEWLAGAGISTVDQLAAAEPEELLRRLLASRAGPPPDPEPAEVRVWIRGARAGSP